MSKIERNFKMLLSILLLVLIDQYIKNYISDNLINENFFIYNNIVEFAPIINTSYSWLNSLGNFGVGLLPHIVTNIIILFISMLILDFIRHKQIEGKTINLLFIFLFAGVFCSLIDKMFWGGSLDYIHLKGLFTFDLKDIYLSIVQIIIISCWIFNYKGLRRTSEKLLYNDFKSYIKEKYLK